MSCKSYAQTNLGPTMLISGTSIEILTFTIHVWSNDTYCSIWVAKVDLQLTHGSDDGNHALNGVAVDYRPVLQTFIL